MLAPLVNAIGDDSDFDSPRGRRTFDSPFWKVMAFICVALFSMILALTTYMGRSALDKLDRLNDNQIRTEVKMEGFSASNIEMRQQINDLRHDVDQLKMDDAAQLNQSIDRNMRNYK